MLTSAYFSIYEQFRGIFGEKLENSHADISKTSTSMKMRFCMWNICQMLNRNTPEPQPQTAAASAHVFRGLVYFAAISPRFPP